MVNTYITSYYKITNDPYANTGQNSIGAPISMLAVGLTLKPALKLSQTVSKIIMIPIAVVVLCVTVWLSSYAPSFFSIFWVT